MEIMISNYFTLSIQAVRQVGGGSLVDSPFDNDYQKTALSIPTRLMIIRTGNLCNFTALAVATGTSSIYNLSKVAEREKRMKLQPVVTTVIEITKDRAKQTSGFTYDSSKVRMVCIRQIRRRSLS